MTLQLRLHASPMHLQCISKALLHTLTHCISDSACYATPHCPLHPCLHTCHLRLFVCLFTFLTSASIACYVYLSPLPYRFCYFISISPILLPPPHLHTPRHTTHLHT